MHNNSSRLLYRAACRRPQGPDNSASACAAYELVAERIRQRDPSRLLTWASRYGAGAVCDRHADVPGLVKESNDLMRNSYLILDEYMRFLNCAGGGKEPTVAILDDLPTALLQANFSRADFEARGGNYPDTWTRDRADTGTGDLEW